MADNPGYQHDDSDTIPSHSDEVSATDLPRKGHWSRHITVEPLLAFYYVAVSISQIAAQNMLLKKSCWPEMEPASAAVCPDEAEAQLVVANINTWKPTVQYSLPIVFVLFAGSWSDNHGGLRKPLIILPILGQMLSDGLLVLNSVCWQWPTIATALCEALPSALCGGRSTLSIGIISYLADITSHETRTFRLGIATSFVFLGAPIGSMLGGILNKYVGFAGTFGVCVVMNLLGLISLLRVPETGSIERATHIGRCCDASQFVQAVRTATRPRQGYYRSSIIILALSIFSLLGPFMGEFSVLYLFVRMKFGWAEDDFGYFAAFKMIVILVGTMLSMGVMSRCLKLSDALIGVLACICQTITYSAYPFINEGWLMYIGQTLRRGDLKCIYQTYRCLFAVALTEIMHGAALTVQKSIVTKLVSSDEMGQVNSILSLTEALVPIVVFPLYNTVYLQTLSVFPGAFYLLSAGLTLPSIVTFSVVFVLLRDNGKLEITNSGAPSDKQTDVDHRSEKYMKWT
ncbi:proton-coupled folate transporter [Anabrus simplex]|uniref:proton-coupled folate transporter n=1 Tax=Anabrus simplex TaxID=316456 RepID=UPI0035A353B8